MSQNSNSGFNIGGILEDAVNTAKDIFTLDYLNRISNRNTAPPERQVQVQATDSNLQGARPLGGLFSSTNGMLLGAAGLAAAVFIIARK